MRPASFATALVAASLVIGRPAGARTGVLVTSDDTVLIYGPGGCTDHDTDGSEPCANRPVAKVAAGARGRRVALAPGWYEAHVPGAGRGAFRIGFVVERGRSGALDLSSVKRPALRARTILVLGRRFLLPDGAKVRTFDDPDGVDVQAEARWEGCPHPVVLPRRSDPKTLQAVAKAVDMVVLHGDLTTDPRMTVRMLARHGLSTHFVINWDGHIDQLADVAMRTAHAGDVNDRSVGIDLNGPNLNLAREPGRNAEKGELDAWRADRARALAWERKHGLKRPVVQGSINGVTVRAYGYTDAQYRALAALLKVLCAVLPRIKPDAPRDAKGQVVRGRVAEPTPAGILAHWHLSPSRWDPGPAFDWKRIVGALSGKAPARR